MAACGAELISVDTHLMQGPCWRQRVPSAARVCLDDRRGRWGPGKATGMPVSFNLREPGVCTSLFKGLLVPAKCPRFLWAMRSISSLRREAFDDCISLKYSWFPSLEVCGWYHLFTWHTWTGLILSLSRVLTWVLQDPIFDLLQESHKEVRASISTTYLLPVGCWTAGNLPSPRSLIWC